MSIVYNTTEKITIKKASELPAEIIDIIAGETDRVRAYRKGRYYYDKLMIDTGKGWTEHTCREFPARKLRKMIVESGDLTIFISCVYTWPSFIGDKGDPGFEICRCLDACDDSVFGNLTFEFYNMADCGDDCGAVVQYGMKEDGTVLRGSSEYEEISEIPDAMWLNEPFTVLVSSVSFPEGCDPDAVNAAVRRLNATQYHPWENMDDFHDKDGEVFINQPKLETPEQRAEFFAALEEVRIATKGGLIFDKPEFYDGNTPNVRMLMLDMDKDTGAVRYYMTKPMD